MIFWLAKLLNGWFGWDIIKLQKRLILAVFVAVFAAVILFVAFVFRACERQPKLDEKQIQKIQDAIATKDREEMTRVLAEAEVAEKKIDEAANDAQARKFAVIQNARQKAAAMTNEQLAAELERKLSGE